MWKKLNVDLTLFGRIRFWLSNWDFSYGHQCIDVGFAVHTTEKLGELYKIILRFHKLIGKSKQELEDEKHA